MEITGTQVIPAPRLQVWGALNEPSILKACLPGCESVERTAPDAFKVVIAAAVGPLRARFTGALKMTETKAPESCVIVFEGQGGAMGFGKGLSAVTLRETRDGTEISYSAKAQVGGKLAQVGSRLIDGVAKKMSDDFFEALRRHAQPQVTTETPKQLELAPADTDRVITERLTGVSPISTAEATEPGLPVAPLPEAGHAPRDAVARLVPAWWLAVAVVLGSAITIASALLLR